MLAPASLSRIDNVFSAGKVWKMTHVFVYQMGKCASTAIVEALRSAGLEAAHTHELGAAMLAKRVCTLTMQPASEFVIEHGVGQLGQNIGFTSEIQRRRAIGDRVQIITVARHPIDWYWSFLIQVFEGQKHALLDSDLIAAYEDAWDRGAERELSQLHRAIVDAGVLKMNHGMRLAADALTTARGNSLAECVEHARRSPSHDDQQAAGFGFDVFLPIVWFSENLEPLTELSVFEQPLAADGSCRMANEWCDLLVLSYERLASLDRVISEFVGRPVSLPLANQSHTKRYSAEVAAIRQRVSLPEVLADLVWTSPYCRHFGYTPSPDATAAAAPDALDVGLSSTQVTCGAAPLSAWITTLRCPSCRSPNLVAADTVVRCGSCGSVYAISQGIVDFVAGRETTTLDDINYDSLYMISDEPTPLFAELKRSAAGRWPTSLGDTLEIGAGTGYQTVPLIMAGEARSLVVTDVSVKMLDICRSRLVRMGLDRRQPLLFLTYGGTESPFRDASFDSCFGSSVVHHILDVGAFLADMARLLRPGGVAFFLEPNARFHRALLSTLADILMDMGHDEPGNPDLPLMVNWLAEVNLNLSHMGDLEFLASREDKHLFFSEEIEGLARQQGFAVAEALPLRPDPCGCQALETYVTQCGVSPRTRTEVVARARQIGQRYFSLLPPRDLSPSFLLWFSKAAAACPPAPRLPAAEPDPLTDNLILYRVELRRDRDTCRVQGWAVGHRPPAWLLLTLNGQPARVPIWLPSVDVNQAFGWRSARLFANALCARLTAEIPIDSAGPILTAAIETADGGRLELTPAEGLALGDEAVILTNASAAVG